MRVLLIVKDYVGVLFVVTTVHDTTDEQAKHRAGVKLASTAL